MSQNSKAEERSGFGQRQCAGINCLARIFFWSFVLASVLGGPNLAAQEIFQGEEPPAMAVFTPPLEIKFEAVAREYEDVFPVKLGKIDYLGADRNDAVYPPLTQQDYIQVTIPNIFISKYQRGWWGATSRNDIYFTLSIDNGDGVLKVYKYDIVPKQMAARFVPVFNAIVLPVEILKGNHLTIKVEGYTLYDKDKTALQSSSDKLLAMATPLMPAQYAVPVGIALSTFNSVLALKSNDKIFDFTITFDVLTSKGAIDTYQRNVKDKKQDRQLLLRPKKYPVINTNENFPLTLNQKDVSKLCTQAGGNRHNARLHNDYQYSDTCPLACNESLKLLGDILTISCDGTNYEPVIDHNYMVIQITPWYRDFSNENFHANISKVRCKLDRISKDEANSLIDESSVQLLASNSYNYLTKAAFSGFLGYLGNYYEIKEQKKEKNGICAGDKKSAEPCVEFRRKLLETVVATGYQTYVHESSYNQPSVEEAGAGAEATLINEPIQPSRTVFAPAAAAELSPVDKMIDHGAPVVNKPQQPADKMIVPDLSGPGDELEAAGCLADVYNNFYGAVTQMPKDMGDALSYEKMGIVLGDYNKDLILKIHDYTRSVLNTSLVIFPDPEAAQIKICMKKRAKTGVAVKPK